MSRSGRGRKEAAGLIWGRLIRHCHMSHTHTHTEETKTQKVSGKKKYMKLVTKVLLGVRNAVNATNVNDQ